MIVIDTSIHDRMRKRLENHYRAKRRPPVVNREDKESDNETTLAVEGIAVLFDEPILTQTGDIVVFERGCFDAHITSGARSEFWFAHDSTHVVGSSDAGMELITNDKFLAFRLPLTNRKYADTVRQKVESGNQSAISVGITRTKERTERWGKHDVVFIEHAECREASLVAEGACSASFARIVNADDCLPLRESVDSVEFKLDSGLHNVRSLQKKIDTLAKYNSDRVTLLENPRESVRRPFTLADSLRWQTEATERMQRSSRDRHSF